MIFEFIYNVFSFIDKVMKKDKKEEIKKKIERKKVGKKR